jgi:sec-independent protein translocase protein TatB
VFGINGWELVIILVVAMLVIGPERLPVYAEQLGSLVRRGRDLLQTAKARVDDELGPEFNDVDWSKLDPRQYDPRKIVRHARGSGGGGRGTREGAVRRRSDLTIR